MSRTRGQSHVVGVALLLGVAVLALGGLTAGIGALVSANAASADTARVADELGGALDPAETTGHDSGRLRFASGQLRTVDREVRILDASGVHRTVDAGGLVFEAGNRRVAYVADAVVRGTGESTWLHEPPPVTATADGDVAVFSVAQLDAGNVTVGGTGGSTVRLRTNVSHRRQALGRGTYGVAVETEAPAALARWFRERNATVSRRDFDGDGTESVVARFPGTRTGYLVVHDVDLEVNGG